MSANDEFIPLDSHREDGRPKPDPKPDPKSGAGYAMKRPPLPGPEHETIADIFDSFMKAGHGAFWKWRVPDEVKAIWKLAFYAGFQSRLGPILTIFQKSLADGSIPPADQLTLLNWQYELDVWRRELLAGTQSDNRKGKR